VIAAMVAACGGSPKPLAALTHPDMSFDEREAAVTRLITASASHDPSAIENQFATDLTYGGLWFADTECRRKFAVAGKIDVVIRGDLARCIASMTLAPSTRTHPYSTVAVLTYDPGIELEVMFDLESKKVRWIGYAARRDDDTLPTVTQAALERLRVDPKPIQLSPESGRALDATTPHLPVRAWLKTCIDAAGAVTGVHARYASNIAVRDVLTAEVRTWKFRPFMLGDQPTPVCAMLFVAVPSDPKDAERFPEPVADGVLVNIRSLGPRVGGNVMAIPSPEEMTAIGRTPDRKIAAVATFCLALDGHVESAAVTSPSGYPTYDRHIIAAVGTLRYKPVPERVCTTAAFVYSQR
jgi:hypothetical protein